MDAWSLLCMAPQGELGAAALTGRPELGGRFTLRFRWAEKWGPGCREEEEKARRGQPPSGARRGATRMET